jgi:hypothetical protein
MARNDKYWDTIDQIYWTPEYIGLRPVRPSSDSERPGLLLIPRSELPAGNSIYTRRVRSQDIKDHLLRKEETLNHVLDIGLAIAPDALVARLIAAPLGFNDTGPFESIGREADRRFGLGENVFQQDRFFVSPRSALALEIKLGSPSSADQLAKYLCMLALEERATGRKENLGLLYVTPEGHEAKLWRSCGLDGPMIPPDLLDQVMTNTTSGVLKRLLERYGDEARDALNRTSLRCVSWTWLRHQLAAVQAELRDDVAGEQCYRRLVQGLGNQIDDHIRTFLEAAP